MSNVSHKTSGLLFSVAEVTWLYLSPYLVHPSPHRTISVGHSSLAGGIFIAC